MHSPRVVSALFVALLLAACGAKQKADEAHKNFKKEIKPAAEFVDDKTHEAVDEGKKGAKKVGDALSGDDSEGGDDESGGEGDE